MEWRYLLDVSKINDKRVDEYDGKKKYSATGDIDYNKIINFEEVDYENKPSRANRIVSSGEILFAKMKGTTKVLKITDEIANDYIFSTGFTTLKNKKELNKDYLYYVLISEYFQNEKDKYSSGATQKAINNTNLKKIKIPVPPMEIQEKIVKVLDQAQALVDKRKEQIETLDQLIESIFYTMFGNPIRNEKGWEVKELEEVLLNNVGNIKKDFKDDISYIDIGSINNNNNSIETYNNFKIKDAPSRAKRILNHGDILFSTVRPNLKNIAIFDIYTENTAIGSTGFCIIRVNESLVNNKYIFNVVKNKRFTGYLVKIAEGASYPAVKDSDIKSIKISIPPLSLQNDFTKKVETIEKQKEVLGESLGLMEVNYKSIMDKAFKGQLFN